MDPDSNLSEAWVMSIVSLLISLFSILLSITIWIWFRVAFVAPEAYWWTSIWIGLAAGLTALMLGFLQRRSIAGLMALIMAIPTTGFVVLWIWLCWTSGGK
jgi:hypothetical protein